MAGKLPRAGASLELDTQDWDKAYKGAMADAAKLDALDPTVKVQVSDAELKTALGLAADLDQSVSMSVNVDESELDAVSDQLNTIATIGAIDLAINVAGTAVGFFEGLGRFSGVGGILELDTALATMEARTGRMIPDAERLISDLYTNGWGESRTEIAGVITQAAQLEIAQNELADATETAFQVAAVTGGDVNEVLNTMDTLVKTGLVDSYTEAGDIMVAGFQNGADRAGDLNDVLSEYGTTFKNFGLSAEGALAVLDSGLENGVYNADVIADSVRELGIRLASIGTDENVTAAFDELDSLSDIDLSNLLDGYEAGKVTGDEMLQGIIDALADVAAVDPAKATTLGASVVGTQLEDMGVSVFTKLSTDADTAFGDIEGRAETAGNTISDTLGTTVDTFLRGVEDMAVNFLSSDSVDLDGKIETFKTQLQTALSTLSEGGSIGDAIELGFGIGGVDTALGNIERVFGQFYLSLLEVLAIIQDVSGKDSSGTRAQIATQAAGQLPLDLQVANPDEFDLLLKQAAERGVSLADLGSALGTAMETSITDGDFERANAIIAEQIATAPSAATVQPFVDKYTALIDEALTAKQTELQGLTGGITAFSLAGFDEAAAAFTSGMNDAIIAENPTAAQWFEGFKPTPEVTTAISDFDGDVTEAMTNVSLVTALASEEMLTALSAMSDGVVSADEEIALAITGNTMTTSFDAMSASAEQNAESTKESFKGILATVSEVDLRMSGFFNGIMAKVSAVNSAIEGIGTVPTGGGGSSVTTNTYNVNTTQNVQSNAQATEAGYVIAAAIRGG